jgi:hypothetical protein
MRSGAVAPRLRGETRPIHFAGLRYWLRALAEYPYAVDKPGNEVFLPFVAAAGYGRVVRLFATLGVDARFPEASRSVAEIAAATASPQLNPK